MLHPETKKKLNCIIHNIKVYKNRGDDKNKQHCVDELSDFTFSLHARNMCLKTQKSINYYRRKVGLKAIKTTALF